MGYVLINGKRYYQDSGGNVSLDNVSQEEADRREKRNALSPLVNNASIHSQRSVPWGVITAVVVVLMAVGAFIYNQSHVSPAEKAIIDYMEDITGTTESLTESITGDE